jgi:hypothetical protein
MTKLTKLLFFVLTYTLALSGCVRSNSVSSPPVELEASPVATPSTFQQALVYMKSQSSDERILGMWAILGYPDKSQEALPIIVQNLYYQQSLDVRSAAARVLGELGPLASTAASDLIKVMQTDSSSDVRVDIAITLGKINNLSAVPALAGNLEEEDYDLAAFSAQSIARLTGENFPDSDSTGFRLNEQGIPLIIIVAREWWNDKGQYSDWTE